MDVKSFVLGYTKGKQSGGGGGGEIEALIDGTITEVNSNATSVRDYAFNSCKSLIAASFPKAVSVGSNAFASCYYLERVKLPEAVNVWSQAFSGDMSLKSADFSKVTRFDNGAFRSCSALVALILRGETVATATDSYVLTWSGVENGTGYIYVPAAIKDTYASATNWSQHATQFRALEDYTVDGTITGELDPNKI